MRVGRRSRCRHCPCRPACLALVLRQQQRGERPPLRARLLPADDHEFLPPGALDLDPALACGCRDSGASIALRDDPFLPRRAHRAEQLLARADDVIGDVDRRLRGGEQRLEPFLALDVGSGRSRSSPFEFEQVEGVEATAASLSVCAPWPRLSTACSAEKSGLPSVAVGDDLAVDQARRQVERGDRVDQRRELVGPVEPVAGVDRAPPSPAAATSAR